MFKKKCSLCGGDLSRGVCTECGLDNNKKRMSQIDDDYNNTHSYGGQSGSKVSNEEFFRQWKQEQKDMENEDVYNRSEQIDYSRPSQKKAPLAPHNSPNKSKEKPPQRPYQRVPQGAPHQEPRSMRREQPEEQKKPVKTVVRMLATVYIVMMVLSVVSGMLSSSNVFDTQSDSSYTYENTITYPDESDYTIILSEDGEDYSIELTAGMYKVGVNIPEGTYEITCINKGCLYVSSNGTYQNSYNYYMEENIGQTDSGINLYEGAWIEISDAAVFSFTSTNVDIDTMVNMENPNEETVQISETSEAGVDFPAGVYDVYISEGTFEIFELYFDPDEAGEDGFYGDVQFYLTNVTYEEDDSEEFTASSFMNVVIPEGSIIYIEEDPSYFEYFELVPSDVIENEDYAGYYEQFEY